MDSESITLTLSGKVFITSSEGMKFCTRYAVLNGIFERGHHLLGLLRLPRVALVCWDGKGQQHETGSRHPEGISQPAGDIVDGGHGAVIILRNGIQNDQGANHIHNDQNPPEDRHHDRNPPGWRIRCKDR